MAVTRANAERVGERPESGGRHSRAMAALNLAQVADRHRHARGQRGQSLPEELSTCPDSRAIDLHRVIGGGWACRGHAEILRS